MKFKSEVQLEALNNATVDTDKFLVSDSSTVKYRTGAEVLSDIGGQSALTNPVTGTGTLNYVSKFTGASTLGNSLIFDNGSAVGIGTTSVSNGFLNVYRSTSGTTVRFSNPSGYVDIGPNNTGGAHIYTDRSQFYMNQRLTLINGQLSSYSPNNLSFMLNSGASTAMTILNTNGNVGIGTTSPTSLLELKQSNIPRITLLKTGIISWYIGNPSQSTSNNFSIGTDSGGNTEILTLTNGGNVGIGTSSPTFSAGGGLQVVRSDHANVRVTGGSSLGLDLLQSTDGTGYLRNRDNAQLRLGTNNVDVITMTNTGNVGIGTTIPAEKLTINATANSNVNAITIYSNNNVAQAYTSIGSYYASGNTNVNSQIRFGNEVSSGGGSYLALATGTSTTATEKMRITSGGNVGIGTTSPSALLNVYGNLHLGAWQNLSTVNIENRTGKSVFYISTDGVNDAVGTTITYSWAGGGHGPLKFNNASGEVMRLDASSKLGVGTTNPTSRIHSVTNAFGPVSFDNRCAVYGHNTSTETTFNNPIGIAGRVLTSGGMAVYGDATSGNGWGGYFLGKGYFSANVGIGTVSPTYRLDITGNDNMFRLKDANGATVVDINGDAGTPATLLKFGDLDGAADNVKFTIDTQGKFLFENAYVGIGTTSPTYPLYVATQVSNISIYADYDIVAYSDQSVKENIRPIENALERVIKSRGVLYDRIDSGEKDNIGFIAQELEVAFPELVVTNEDGTKAVKYQNAVAVLFEAVKEQQKQIDEIKRILNGITN